MHNFRLKPDVKYAIDVKGVSIIKSKVKSYFFEYPEAAVWLIFANKFKQVISINKVQIVLSGYVNNPEEFVKGCFFTWKKENLIF